MFEHFRMFPSLQYNNCFSIVWSAIPTLEAICLSRFTLSQIPLTQLYWKTKNFTLNNAGSIKTFSFIHSFGKRRRSCLYFSFITRKLVQLIRIPHTNLKLCFYWFEFGDWGSFAMMTLHPPHPVTTSCVVAGNSLTADVGVNFTVVVSMNAYISAISLCA
jgi:hypothetical protein